MKKTVWSALDHQIWKNRGNWPVFRRLLIGLSGGADSVALLNVFQRLSKVGHFELIAVNVHHGSGENESWRAQAQEFCGELCGQLGVQYVLAGPSPRALSSEAEFRDYRYEQLRALRVEKQCDFILTAHHADDVLETRLLRLLRGTGPLGLEGFREHDADLWRPFFKISKQEIQTYINQNQLAFIEDPSNASTDPMRNWVRNEVLPMLERRQAGTVGNFARSLQLLVEALDKPLPLETEIGDGGDLVFERGQYLSLSPVEQRTFLAKLLLKLEIRNYSRGLIEEIQKRLDNQQKVHNFTLGATSWVLDARQVKVKKRG